MVLRTSSHYDACALAGVVQPSKRLCTVPTSGTSECNVLLPRLPAVLPSLPHPRGGPSQALLLYPGHDPASGPSFFHQCPITASGPPEEAPPEASPSSISSSGAWQQQLDAPFPPATAAVHHHAPSDPLSDELTPQSRDPLSGGDPRSSCPLKRSLSSLYCMHDAPAAPPTHPYVQPPAAHFVRPPLRHRVCVLRRQPSDTSLSAFCSSLHDAPAAPFEAPPPPLEVGSWEGSQARPPPRQSAVCVLPQLKPGDAPFYVHLPSACPTSCLIPKKKADPPPMQLLDGATPSGRHLLRRLLPQWGEGKLLAWGRPLGVQSRWTITLSMHVWRRLLNKVCCTRGDGGEAPWLRSGGKVCVCSLGWPVCSEIA